jgi:hypothetical protein
MVNRYVSQWSGGIHGTTWNNRTQTLWVTVLGTNALGRAHGLDFEGDAVSCLFSTDLQIQKLDMKTGTLLDAIQLSKDDPDPHGLCIHEGSIYYRHAASLLAATTARAPVPGISAESISIYKIA